MLGGVFRKLSLPVLLLSLLGWVLYVVGFGFRNASYDEQSNSTAAAPDYIFWWFFLCTSPVVYILACVHCFWENKAASFLAVIFTPLFLVSLGGVLFFNGLQIYVSVLDDSSINSFNVSASASGSGSGSESLGLTEFNLRCTDARARDEIDIFDEEKYILMEFIGALFSVLFFWLYMMFVPFFSNKSVDDPYFGKY